MNKRNILKVADAIETHSIPWLGFNMNLELARFDEVAEDDRTGRHCGTVGCIAGWAVAMSRHMTSAPEESIYFRYDEPTKWLGLSDDTADALFYPRQLPPGSWDDITPAHAVAVLRHLAKTGKVDWTVGAP